MDNPSSLGHAEHVTRADLDARFAVCEARLDTRFAQNEARFEVKFARLEAVIERGTATQIRWLVGVVLPLYVFLFAFMLFIVSRELPRP